MAMPLIGVVPRASQLMYGGIKARVKKAQPKMPHYDDLM
jgi:hypothetical protein